MYFTHVRLSLSPCAHPFSLLTPNPSLNFADISNGVKTARSVEPAIFGEVQPYVPSTARKRNESCSNPLVLGPFPSSPLFLLLSIIERLSTTGSRESWRIDEVRELQRFRSPGKVPFCRLSARSRLGTVAKATFLDLSNLLLCAELPGL